MVASCVSPWRATREGKAGEGAGCRERVERLSERQRARTNRERAFDQHIYKTFGVRCVKRLVRRVGAWGPAVRWKMEWKGKRSRNVGAECSRRSAGGGAGGKRRLRRKDDANKKDNKKTRGNEREWERAWRRTCEGEDHTVV